MLGYKITPRPKVIVAFYPYYANFHDPFFNDFSRPPSEELMTLLAGVNQSITNIELHINDARSIFFRRMCYEKKQSWALVSRDPNEPAESIIKKLKRFSAVDNVDRNFPPTYLSHGLQDTAVLFTQSIQMAKKLEENNIEFVLDLVDGAIHAYDLEDQSLETFEEYILPAFNFAAKFMK